MRTVDNMLFWKFDVWWEMQYDLTLLFWEVKVDTSQNTTLATGEYTIRIETFASSDGVYYGLTASDYVEQKLYIINGVYGLKVITSDEEKIFNKVKWALIFKAHFLSPKLLYLVLRFVKKYLN